MGKGGDHSEEAEGADWVSVDGERYDVRAFRHPGGKHLLRPWLGRDATAPFVAFHPNMEIPRKCVLSCIAIFTQRTLSTLPVIF